MKKLVLVCALLLIASGCGDDKKPSDDALGDVMNGKSPSGMPTPESMQDVFKNAGKIKLTDDMMKDYVAMLSELKGVRTPGAALLAKYHFTAQKWVKIAMIIGTSKARVGVTDALPKLDAQIAKLKAKRDAAPPEQRAGYDRTLQMMESQRSALGGMGHANDIDRENAAVYERWKDRVEAAGRK